MKSIKKWIEFTRPSCPELKQTLGFELLGGVDTLLLLPEFGNLLDHKNWWTGLQFNTMDLGSSRVHV